MKDIAHGLKHLLHQSTCGVYFSHQYEGRSTWIEAFTLSIRVSGVYGNCQYEEHTIFTVTKNTPHGLKHLL